MLSILLISVAIVVGGLSFLQREPDDLATRSDSDLLQLADATPEGQAFHARYGSAATTVDRSGRVAVDFRSGGAGAGADQGVRLRLFIESGPAVRGGFLECTRGVLITKNVAGAIRENACGGWL